MSLHHNSIESKKIDIKQIEIIKNNTSILYCLMNILRDKWIMSALFLRFDENSFMRLTRVHHFAFDDDDDDDDQNDDDEDNNDDDDQKNDDDQKDDDDQENDNEQKSRQNDVDVVLEENRNVINVESFEKKEKTKKDDESMNDQNDDVNESRKSEMNDDVNSSQDDVDENRALRSSSSSFSFSEFCSFDKKIDSSATSQRRVASEFTFDSKSSFDLRRSSRRSSKTSFEKEKRFVFSEKNVESSLKRRRRRSEF